VALSSQKPNRKSTVSEAVAVGVVTSRSCVDACVVVLMKEIGRDEVVNDRFEVLWLPVPNSFVYNEENAKELVSNAARGSRRW
jgi:hypothetical protein